mmetsp:Transcript_13941/g.48550  ORF Transcript_13941/g.48550 Transcript_13941/m.48550 type:complete len:390 (+) Transcript_13941:9258-10427(+)
MSVDKRHAVGDGQVKRPAEARHVADVILLGVEGTKVNEGARAVRRSHTGRGRRAGEASTLVVGLVNRVRHGDQKRALVVGRRHRVHRLELFVLLARVALEELAPARLRPDCREAVCRIAIHGYCGNRHGLRRNDADRELHFGAQESWILAVRSFPRHALVRGRGAIEKRFEAVGAGITLPRQTLVTDRVSVVGQLDEQDALRNFVVGECQIKHGSARKLPCRRADDIRCLAADRDGRLAHPLVEVHVNTHDTVEVGNAPTLAVVRLPRHRGQHRRRAVVQDLDGAVTVVVATNVTSRILDGVNDDFNDALGIAGLQGVRGNEHVRRVVLVTHAIRVRRGIVRTQLRPLCLSALGWVVHVRILPHDSDTRPEDGLRQSHLDGDDVADARV